MTNSDVYSPAAFTPPSIPIDIPDETPFLDEIRYGIPNNDAAALLYRAVIVQAFTNATSRPSIGGIHTKLSISEAQSWLLTPSRDLCEVCDIAEVDPCSLVAAAHQLSMQNWPPLPTLRSPDRRPRTGHHERCQEFCRYVTVRAR